MNNTIDNLTVLPNVVVFQFRESVVDGKFINKRSSGLVDDLGHDYLSYGGISRCCIVSKVGANVRDYQIGDEVIVENLKWTPEFNLSGSRYWMTTSNHILGIVSR